MQKVKEILPFFNFFFFFFFFVNDKHMKIYISHQYDIIQHTYIYIYVCM